MVTTITYKMTMMPVHPYADETLPAPMCCRIVQPNGMELYFSGGADGLFDSDWPGDLGDGEPYTQQWQEWAGPAASGTKLVSGAFLCSNPTGLGYPAFAILMYDTLGDGWNPDAGLPDGTLLAKRLFDNQTYNLIEEYCYTFPHVRNDLSASRHLQEASADLKTTWVVSTKSYNFMGGRFVLALP